MNIPAHSFIKRSQAGTTLIEVLVALLVFTIGLQGAISLQYQAMKDNFDSAQRSHGVWAAHELINRIRANNKEDIEARGQDLRYEFDYLLLCNKICGKSHYNMQMKIVVETEEEYKAWLSEQKTFKNSLVQN